LNPELTSSTDERNSKLLDKYLMNRRRLARGYYR
jgi:hypothetical protein